MSWINFLWNATKQMQIEEAKDAAKNAKFEAQLTAQEAISEQRATRAGSL